MSAGLPTDSAFDMAVREFGLGTYDSTPEGEGEKGEDSNEKVTKKSLPDGGGPTDPYGPDRLLSYPDEHPVLAASLPGDDSVPVQHEHPDMETIEDPVMTVGQDSELPDDNSNPPARSDYYDQTVVGLWVEEPWADEDAGAWAGKETADSALPSPNKNEVTMDDFLGALGNYWSGYEVEDVLPTQGFPSTDLAENADFPKSNDDSSGGRLLARNMKDMDPKLAAALEAFGRDELSLGRLYDTFTGGHQVATGWTGGQVIDSLKSDPAMRTATNLSAVGDLTEKFIKEYGKKDLTKRHVLAFLQKAGQPQFLSSDIIRCLKHRHEIYVKDVLDEFPVAKLASAASNTSIAKVRDQVIDLEIANVRDPKIAAELRRVAAVLSTVMVGMERLEK